MSSRQELNFHAEEASSRHNRGDDEHLSHETLSHGPEVKEEADQNAHPSSFTVNNIAKGEDLNLLSDSDLANNKKDGGNDSDYPNEDEEMKITTSKPLRGRQGGPGHRDLSR